MNTLFLNTFLPWLRHLSTSDVEWITAEQLCSTSAALTCCLLDPCRSGAAVKETQHGVVIVSRLPVFASHKQ
jgi:hypothetical protein